MSQEILTPRPLAPGDRIAILSPAGIIKPQFVYGAMKVLQDQGWNPYVAEHTFGRHGTYSGTAEERLSDIKAALSDPSTRAILCSRGGYGTVHLLDELQKLPLRSDPKWIIGYSDISALHALMTANGIESIHSPMTKHISTFGGADDDSQALFDTLRGNRQTYRVPSHEYNRHGSAQARLVGGNLVVLASLISTPFDVFEPGTILFIEDISEPIYKVERILYQLRLSGVLANLAGLIVGRFTSYSPDADNASMEDMIRALVADYDYPVAFDVPVGHVDHNIPLVESRLTTLNVTPLGVDIIQ